MSHTIGERAVCSDCGRFLTYTSEGWRHAGVNQPPHEAMPTAMPQGSVWVGDAPADKPEDATLVESGILPKPIDAAENTPVSPNWQAEPATIDSSTWLEPQLNLRSSTSPRNAADQLRAFYTSEWIADLLVALLSRTAFTEGTDAA